MSDTEVAEPQVEAKKGLPIKLIAMVVVGLGVLGGAYVMFLAPGGDEVDGEVVEEGPVFSDEEGEIVPVADATWSLAGPDAHFARLSFSAVLSVDALATEVEPRFPLLADAAVTVLAGMSAEELRTPVGLDRLRLALMDEATKIWPDGEVVRMLLGEVVVQ